MKNALMTLLQFVVFVLTFAGGSFLAPMHLRQVLAVTGEGTRVFVWDGVVLMTLVCVLILLIEQVRGHLRTAGRWTVAAYVLAAGAGLALKLGFMTL
ncbi:MAG: hypothetical protein M3O02_05955 [Acidobacteriota bacterium]|nr:hypothetical protein [Acidobacteriota bacterium]